MIGGSPVASRTITGHTSEFFPITVFFNETLTPEDLLLPSEVEAPIEETLVLNEILLPSDVSTSLEESLSLDEYVVALSDDILQEYWKKVSSPTTVWRRVKRT